VCERAIKSDRERRTSEEVSSPGWRFFSHNRARIDYDSQWNQGAARRMGWSDRRTQRSMTMVAINESNLDRAIRIFVGFFLLLVATLLYGAWQWMFGAASALLLLTGIIGFSPLYRLIGVNTLDS
jgi:hypothetical protein